MTSFWRNNDVIIMSCVQGEDAPSVDTFIAEINALIPYLNRIMLPFVTNDVLYAICRFGQIRVSVP